MDTSFYMSGLVNLGATHSALFEMLGLPASPVMTMGQLQNLLAQAEGALAVMTTFDPDSDQVAEWLTRQILDDLVEQFAGAAPRVLANTGGGPRLPW